VSTLDRYLLGKILRTFVPACLGLCFLFFVVATLNLLRKQDLSLSQVMLALPWIVPFLLPYLIPISYAATLALVYGRLVADNEVLAFGSLGVPQRSLAWPAIFFSGFLVVIVGMLAASVVPQSSQHQRAAAHAVFQQLGSLDSGEHLSRAFRKQQLSFYVRHYDSEGLHGVVLHFHRGPREGGASVQLVARHGKIDLTNDGLLLALQGVTATLVPSGAPTAPIRLHLDRYAQPLSVGRSSGRRKAKDLSSALLREELTTSQRKQALASVTGGLLAAPEGIRDTPLEAGIHLASRATLALTPFLSTLIVVPIAFLLRARNALVPFAVGLGAVCAVVFGALQFGASFAEQQGHAELAWVGVGISLAAAGALGLGARRA
jgi:lipopolysaccharide export LptBFGC system permease protein LptF